MAYRWTFIAMMICACQSKPSVPPPAAESGGSGAGSGSSTDESRGVSLTTVDAPAVKLPQQTSFKLLEAGAEPRAPLRYTTAATHSYLTKTELTTRRLQGVAWSPLAKTPAVTTGVSLTGTPGKITGRALAAETAEPAHPDAQAMIGAWRILDGRRFSVPVDERGQLGDPGLLDDPSGATSAAPVAELSQRFLLTMVPLPEEPVGVGASWRVVTILKSGPFVVKQTASYKLLAAGERWKVEAQIQRIAEPQPVRDPALAPGTLVDLIMLLRRYSGTLELQPDRVFGTGALDVNATLHLRVLSPGKSVVEEIVEDQGTITFSTTD